MRKKRLSSPVRSGKPFRNGKNAVDKANGFDYNTKAVMQKAWRIKMKLDLREIIEIPGASLPFRCTLDVGRLDFPSVARYNAPPEAEGVVQNTAGVLSLEGTLRADMVCVCDRCAREYACEKELPLSVTLAADVQEGEDEEDVFPLEGNFLDLDDVLETCFILDMEAKHLCREDCKGLCERCGANLNDGPCGCKATADPRLAVLEQLLDK